MERWRLGGHANLLPFSGRMLWYTLTFSHWLVNTLFFFLSDHWNFRWNSTCHFPPCCLQDKKKEKNWRRDNRKLTTGSVNGVYLCLTVRGPHARCAVPQENTGFAGAGFSGLWGHFHTRPAWFSPGTLCCVRLFRLLHLGRWPHEKGGHGEIEQELKQRCVDLVSFSV